MGEATSRTLRSAVAIGAVAGAVGIITSIVTMASAPPYPVEEHARTAALYPVLLCAAVIGGFVLPRYTGLIGLMLGLPGLFLSTWSPPRGETDGLWLLIQPFLAVFVFVRVFSLAVLVFGLVVAAAAGAWLRRRVTGAAEAKRS